MSRLLDAMTIADYVAIGALIVVLLLGWGFGFAYSKKSKTKRHNHTVKPMDGMGTER